MLLKEPGVSTDNEMLIDPKLLELFVSDNIRFYEQLLQTKAKFFG